MRLTVRAASCLAALAMTFAATPAGADPSVCSQRGVSCDLLGSHCHEGDYVYVVVLGAVNVKGLASCTNGDGFTQYVRCEGVGLCLDSEVADEEGRLGCDVQTPTSIAICFTLPVLLSDVDQIICPILATSGPAVNLAGAGLVAVDSEGDVFIGGYTGNEIVWDCPVYLQDGDWSDGVFD